MDEIRLLGTKITSVTVDELNKKISEVVKNDEKQIVSHVNIHGMNLAYKIRWFKEFLNQNYINFCDGDGVRLGAKLLGKHIPEKITYNRWIWQLAEVSNEKNWSWYILGSSEDVINECHKKIMELYPNITICGKHHGFLSDLLERKVVEEIKQKKPNILIIGMGMPIQENFLKKNFDELKFNVALPGGAVFEYVSGNAKMTPDIFFKLKLEWFYRFLQEPARLFRRYFIGNPVFILRIIMEKYRIIKPS